MIAPEDITGLVLAGGRGSRREMALASTLEAGVPRVQPVFCLMKATLLESLVRFTHGGGRKIDRWTAPHRCVIDG